MKWSSDDTFGTDIPIAVTAEQIAAVAHLAHRRVPVEDLPDVLRMLGIGFEVVA